MIRGRGRDRGEPGRWPALDLSTLPVVDGHCHPLLRDPWAIDPAAFLTLFSEGRPGAMTAHVPHTGYYSRALRAFVDLLDAAPTVEAILARRRALGRDGARRVWTNAHVTALLVDTGYPPDAMPLEEMRRLLPCPIHEVFRIETCAESLLREALPWHAFRDRFQQELRAAAARCVAFKSIIAYRSGLAIRAWDPDAVGEAYRQAVARRQAGGPARLVEKPLLDTLFGETLEVAAATGRPVQVHAGFGDPDIDLLHANPLLLRPVLEDPRWAGLRLVLLHLAYPYFREAAFMAAIWPQVFVDLSLVPAFLGPGSIAPLAETLSLAPASKLLYGSDLGALPELFVLAGIWTRDVLGEALGWLVARGGLTTEEAHDAGRRVLAENAVALYGLPAPRVGRGDG